MKPIATIQVMRGFAALAVVLYHTHIILKQPEYGGHIIFASFANHGLLGVNFFFILSGFIILLSHRRELNNVNAIPAYLYRRAVRLYPAYWVFLTAYVIAAAAGLGQPDFSWAPLNLLQSYLLVHLGEPVSLPLQVAWTLFYEVRFYLAFVFLLWSVPVAMVFFSLWMLAIVVAFFLDVRDQFDLLSPWNIYFIFGMVACVAADRIPNRFGFPILLAGLLMILLYAANYNLRMSELKSDFEYLLFWLAPAFSLTIVGAVLVERRYHLTMPHFLMFVGDASYSIYLVHSAAISLIVLIGRQFGLLDAVNPYVLFVGVFVLATVAGSIAYLLVERPLLELLRKTTPRAPKSK